MNQILSAGIVGLLSALAVAVPATAAPVTIRVEGGTRTVLPNTVVDPSGVGTITRGGGSCAGADRAAGVLELATRGAWDGTYDPDFSDIYVSKVFDETLADPNNSYWQLIVNDQSASAGLCNQQVRAGDEVVLAATCFSPGAQGCRSGGFLGATGPRTAAPGQSFEVTVKQTDVTYPPPTYDPVVTTSPAPGATVTGGGASATTNASGVASLTSTQRGAVALRVTRENQIPDQVDLCVTDGADGYCGTRRPDGTTLPPEIGGTPATPAAPDTSAPEGTITGIAEGQRFSRSKAPRRLTADVSDPSGVLQVKLALTRQVGKRCWWFSGSRERFVRSRCGKRPRFKLDGTGNVDYLLPERLGKGRYVFDVLAVDKAYNRDELARGRNRVVFTVR